MARGRSLAKLAVFSVPVVVLAASFGQSASAQEADLVIPLDTVIIMYKWSKKKSHRPYQYFEKGMKVQAKRLGVDLLARAEEDPKGGFRNFFRDLRISFRPLRVQF